MVDESIRRTRESVNELNIASILQAMESSVEIMYESSEDATKIPEIVIFNIFLPVNMSIAVLDSSIENPKAPLLSLLFHCIFHISSTVNSATGWAEVAKSWKIAKLHGNQPRVCLSMGGWLRWKHLGWKQNSWIEV